MNKDSDGNSIPDYREGFAGTDAFKASDVLQVTIGRDQVNGVVLEWLAKPDRLYHVEYAPAVTGAPWQRLTVSPLTKGSFLDQAPLRTAQPKGYYRVTAE
ncbi:MAG: hypothetical protein ACI9DF_005028 [Verrucomicrobiales bacterium]